MTDDRSLHGWRRPGPIPPGGVEPADGETLDALAGFWKIFQLDKGHRFSVDDTLTAAFAVAHAPRIERALDLGSGIGSVPLLIAWRCPGAHFVTVEAQARSLALAKKSAQYNGVSARFDIREADLRELKLDERFDLVTGTPPYWPLGTHRPSPYAQAVPARLETRGDVFDYARAARAHLAPGGVFVFVFPRDQDQRARAALEQAQLTLERVRPVRFKEGADYGFNLYLAFRQDDLPALGPPVVDEELVLRTTSGHFSPDYARVRLSYGFPPGS